VPRLTVLKAELIAPLQYYVLINTTNITRFGKLYEQLPHLAFLATPSLLEVADTLLTSLLKTGSRLHTLGHSSTSCCSASYPLLI
jgi:hypothetical protein